MVRSIIALTLLLAPAVQAARLRAGPVNVDGSIVSINTPFGQINVGRGDDGHGTNVETPFINITTNGHGTNVTSSLTNVTTSGSGTIVSTPITNVTTGRNGTTVTTPAGEVVNVSGNGTNTTGLTPADCRAWSRSDPCRADVDPYFRVVSSNTTDDTTKDQAVEDFCSTECGTRYTARISGLVSGFCANVTDDTATTSTTKAAGAKDEGEPLHRHLAKKSTDSDAAALLAVRAGGSLGCIKNEDGKKCALLKGCDFYKSCCAGSLVAARKNAGVDPINADTIDTIENACPGARAYLAGERGLCF